MILQNKKTGEIKIIDEVLLIRDDDGDCWSEGRYASLAELNEEWEDYKPQEPLIKDEKIRKAVRAWAEACGYDGACIVEYDKRFNELSGIGHTTVISLGEIDFNLEDRKRYTIEELCGTPEPLEPTFIDLDERIKEKDKKPRPVIANGVEYDSYADYLDSREEKE